MIRLNAHFDGKVLVPDEPLNLRPNQKVRVILEPVERESKPRFDWQSLRGIAKNTSDRPYDPAEEDALWEGTTGNYLENGPNKPSMRKPEK